MSHIKNLLISFLAFWLSLRAVVPLSILLGKLTDRVVYDDGFLGAISMGMMTSLGRTLCAVLAAVLVWIFADNMKRLRWTFVVAILNIAYAPVRYGKWHIQPTWWDYLEKDVSFLFPAVACIAATVVIAHFWRGRHRQASNQPA
jgi:hypothetical protein